MNCNHPNNNHCHECEKATHWDFYFAIVSIVGVIFMFYVAGWRAFIDFWPFWLVVGIVLLSGLVVWWDKKKKQEQAQKEKEEATKKKNAEDKEKKNEDENKKNS